MIPPAINSKPALTHRMKLIIGFFAFLTSLSPLCAADDSPKIADPFAGALFPPELVLLAQDRIALTPEQLEAVRARVMTVQQHSEELRLKLERETAALAALAKQDKMDEAVIVAQLDKVLDVEREVKHLHVGLAVAIKNLLTPDQQARLREISLEITKNGVTQLQEEVAKRISEKVARVKEGAQKWASSGRDPSPITQAMEEKFKPLMEGGQSLEAEAELDRVLKLFTQDTK